MTRLHQFTVAALALTLSGGLHAAGFIGLTPQTHVALQGGTADSLPTLGDSFADMAQGAAFAAPPPQTVKPETATLEATAKAIPAVKHSVPVRPVQATALPMAEALPAVNTLQMAALSPVTPPDTLPPAPETARAASDQSMRPQPRPDPAPQGNADRNATRGTTTGQDTAKAAPAAAPAGQSTIQGDGGAAASASYGRAVLTQISRTRKARAPSRGRTVVAFSISDAGALASVQVLHSSGSPDLDRVAMDHIRRAAPFPKPPSGAQRQFSFEFVGRS